MKNRLLILFGVLILFGSCREKPYTDYQVTIVSQSNSELWCNYLTDTIHKDSSGRFWFKAESKDCAVSIVDEKFNPKRWITNSAGTNLSAQARDHNKAEQKTLHEKDVHENFLIFLILLCIAVVACIFFIFIQS